MIELVLACALFMSESAGYGMHVVPSWSGGQEWKVPAGWTIERVVNVSRYHGWSGPGQELPLRAYIRREAKAGETVEIPKGCTQAEAKVIEPLPTSGVTIRGVTPSLSIGDRAPLMIPVR